MGAEAWAQALGQRQGGQFRLRFERLGLEAACRSLSSGEVEECLRMGGERGLRYPACVRYTGRCAGPHRPIWSAS